MRDLQSPVARAASLAEEFRLRGFVVLARALSPAAVDDALRQLEAISGRTRAGWPRGRGIVPSRGVAGAWTLPDGVTKRPELWRLIFEEEVLAAVRDLVGQDAAYLQHTDLHVGFSAVGWHRDNVNRVYGVGPDWNESREPYRLVRVGFYLQTFAESGFRLGFIPGSHRAGPPRLDGTRAAIESKTGGFWNALALVTGRSPLDDLASWVQAEQGDAVLFDPRILHAGKEARGPKYSAFLAFGAPNGHFHRHASYYRGRRPELGYGDLPSDLTRRLSAARLPGARGAAPGSRRPRCVGAAALADQTRPTVARPLKSRPCQEGRMNHSRRFVRR